MLRENTAYLFEVNLSDSKMYVHLIGDGNACVNVPLRRDINFNSPKGQVYLREMLYDGLETILKLREEKEHFDFI